MSYTNPQVAADAVAQLLWKLETQLDEAFATGGELLAALPRARAAANLPAIAGQQAFELFGQAVMALGTARGHTVAGHRIVEKVGRQIGYETSFGDEKPKPDFAPTGIDAAHLRIAA
ncbi:MULTISPECIES: hypothetical protein [Sphingomonas]|jgi:hypothetical protein|uniref:hypothetical protein n=1 Tax=Sphingomonas TaxID=13687 RepID=UPI001AEF0DB2|nr:MULTISPECIES: hypothetical protein [Sphingomonas]